jgi:hypothetical protein
MDKEVLMSTDSAQCSGIDSELGIECHPVSVPGRFEVHAAGGRIASQEATVIAVGAYAR